jgi:S1-C subfamily serine protease
MLLPLFLAVAHLPVQSASQKPAPPAASPAAAVSAVVRVNSTNQSYDFARPWDKKSPYPRRGAGVILSDGNVLVTAELVANRTHLEIEKPLTADKSQAEVIAVDYDANLALLKPLKEGFLDGLGRMALAEGAKVGSVAEILQLENTGEIARTPATITTIAVGPYPLDSLSLLTFKLSSPLQSRDSSFVLPAVLDGRLLGLLMRYDARSQTAEVIPPPVIRSFLDRAQAGPYSGFPRLGVGYASTRDPQLRAYLKLQEAGGVYITEVQPGSPADSAGLRKGDILLKVDDRPIDQDGLYEDSQYGKILFTHLVTSRKPDAGPLNVSILRDRKPLTLEVLPKPSDPTKTISESQTFDKAPKYVVLGGLIFQELSRAYLREWGGNWRKTAPQRLVYLDAFQSELPTDRGKIVFLSSILPSPDTLGYENLESLVVTKVNDIEIKSLSDLSSAAKSPVNGYHKIEFEEDPGVIYLDAEAVQKNQEPLARDYGITTLERL